MNTWEKLAPRLVSGQELTYEEAHDLMDQVMSGELGEIRLSSLLSLLAMRGVRAEELAAMADSMREHARHIDLPRTAVDIVGTGGDQANTVNISTMAAVAIAAAGTPVVKHGNRASTSASGSADVLEALGVKLEMTESQIARSFAAAGIAFLFANNFHPSMRFAAGVRGSLAYPTVFNILGPLTNPARPRASAIGVANPAAAPLMASVFARRGTSALVFRGADRGLDEITTAEPTQIWTVYDGEVSYQEIDPAADFGFAPASLADLRGGTPRENADVARRVFAGEPGPVTDAVTLNAAAGLAAAAMMDGQAPATDLRETLAEPLQTARETLESGKAAETLAAWIAATEQ